MPNSKSAADRSDLAISLASQSIHFALPVTKRFQIGLSGSDEIFLARLHDISERYEQADKNDFRNEDR